MRLAILLVLFVPHLALAQSLPIAEGPFQGDLESLRGYRCPEWFRDAKFGIWAHWGPQAVPMEGDWYAKHMYVQGHRQYEHHLATYGHPSEHGYKEIIALWKAEKWDLERGVMPKINPDPWQTDTSIGDWYYNKHWQFRPVAWTIHMLVDIVSKNGNLLLNVVQRPDGSLDPEVEEALEQMAEWITVHGEAIYDTRPWGVYGEGGVRYKGGHFKEDFSYSSKDIRFTTKGSTLYAIALGWPADGKLLVRSLATPAGKVTAVSVLGSASGVAWQETDEGLVVTVPEQPVSKYTCALKIVGEDLKPAPVPEVVVTVSPDAQGIFHLVPDDATLNGEQIKIEAQGGQPNIGFWDRADESVGWTLNATEPGEFAVSASCATIHAGGEFIVEAAGQQLTGKPAPTASWADFRAVDLGRIRIERPGQQVLTVRARDAQSWKAINLRWVKLVPAK